MAQHSTPAGAAGAPTVTPTGRTSALLACGIVAGPLFLAVVRAQAFAREGFDLGRHPLSLLSLGELGWIQIANFVVTGALYVACAVGMWQVLHPGRSGTWGPVLVGALWVAGCVGTAVAVLVLVSWPDIDSTSVRLVVASAILFGFVAALAARLLRGLPDPVATSAAAGRARRLRRAA
jgi:Protein of unknown function (DUF998)